MGADGEMRQPLDIALQGNPVSRKPRYKVALLVAFPSLQVIDGKGVTDEERERAVIMSSDT
jgi:hypothetical protein